MKIKSLLLGSAAALVAVSGAQAADAIIVEPEPMEYVKVCDMYGAGYFYIPGTETCLKISGHVRIDYRVRNYHEEEYNGTSNHSTLIRGRLGFTAKNETEYGTLGSDVVLTMYRSNLKDEFSSTDGAHGDIGLFSGLTKATINLAGFRMGYDGVGGTAWMRYGGYGYYNARNDGFYYEKGGYTAAFFEYGGSAGGINYVIGVQDGQASGTPGAPDAYIGMTTAVGGLSLQAIAMYDSNGGDGDTEFVPAVAADPVNFIPAQPSFTRAVSDGSGGIAYKIRADYDLSSFIPGGSIGAWWAADDGNTDYVKGHKWGVTMKANLTSNMVAFAGYSQVDFADYVDDVTSGPRDTADWTAGVRWNLVPGMWVQAEYNKARCISGSDCTFIAGEDADSRETVNVRFFRSF